MRTTFVRLGLTALMLGVLAACGGGSSNNDTVAAAPAAPAGGGAAAGAPAAAAVPAGAAPITITAATPAATIAALAPVVAFGGVTINSPPCVSFSMADANNNGIIGFGSKAQSATATVASYPNLSFALAKLVPGVGTAPSRWVSYIVTTVPTYKSATDQTIVASVPTRPTTDNTGTLTDNKNGTYTYCFYRDVKAVAAQVAAATFTGNNVAADLDDLSYDATLVHRLTIQISGNAPGTGTNTANAVQVTPGVPMANPVNAIYDFIPATGKAVTASGRDIVATANCNQCHQNLGGFPTATSTESDATFHGGSRNKTEYCVVCHTEQRKYGQPEAATVTSTVTGKVNFDGVSAADAKVTTGKGTYRIYGLATGSLGRHMHKIHMSSNQTKIGYNYGGILYEEACKFPMDVKNCTKCHDGSANAATLRTGSTTTAQGDNWMKAPNRSACGACHDGINFTSGKGLTLADNVKGLTTSTYGHVGGSQSDDSACALCHKPADINTYHIPTTAPDKTNSLLSGGTNSNTNAAWIASNKDRLPTGAIVVTYDISSVSVNASKNPVMVFRMLQNGARTDFNTYSATGKTELWDNFMGAPSVYYVFSVPQDGVTAPADFNASVSVYLRSLWNGSATGTGAGTLTGPDSNGYYTATLTGTTMPTSAVMLTGGLGYSYSVINTLPLTQTNLADYPTTAATATSGLTTGMPNKTGGLIVIAPDAQVVASGYTGRRAIVQDALCNKCHLELGAFTEEEFHAGQRNDGSTCSWCHNPNKASSGWTADSTNFVHAIHAAAKRTVKYNWHAASATDGFYNIGYPGILSNCETCHLPGTYDFSAAASSAALPNRLFRTVMTGTSAAATFSTSPYIAQTAGTAYGSGFSYSVATQATTQAAGTTLVISPIMTVCVSCHDGVNPTTGIDAKTHMTQNGGAFYAARSTLYATGTTNLTNNETCMLCHNPTGVAAIKAMHAK